MRMLCHCRDGTKNGPGRGPPKGPGAKHRPYGLAADSPTVDHTTFRRRTDIGVTRHGNFLGRGDFNPPCGSYFNPARRNGLYRLADLHSASRCFTLGTTNTVYAFHRGNTGSKSDRQNRSRQGKC
jgi:hypothetical protein